MSSRIAVLVACIAMFTFGQNWPQFRGPDGKGLAVGHPPVNFAPEEKTQVWKTSVPFGQSSPSIWGNRIFLTSGDRDGKQLTSAAYDRFTGKIVWQKSIPVEKVEQTHPRASPATATVLADEERVYVYFGSWGLLAYDHDGKELWSVRLPLPQKVNGSGTSPILGGEYVLLNRDDPAEAYLLALDRKTGKQAWKQSYGEPAKGPGMSNTSTPALAGDEVIVHRNSEIVALDAKSGSRRWYVKINSTGVGTPVIAGDSVYVATWNNFGEPELRKAPPAWEDLVKGDKDGDGLLAKAEMPATISLAQRTGVDYAGAHLNLPPGVILSMADANKDGKLSREEYQAFLGMIQKFAGGGDHGLLAIRRGGEGEVSAANLLWKYSRNVAEVPTPLYSNDRVYMVTNGGIVTCNDAKTGKVIYRERLGAPGMYLASPVAANRHIYFASGEGMVTVVREADTLEVVARNDLQEAIHATPAIIGNTIYIRTVAHLYAFATPGP